MSIAEHIAGKHCNVVFYFEVGVGAHAQTEEVVSYRHLSSTKHVDVEVQRAHCTGLRATRRRSANVHMSIFPVTIHSVRVSTVTHNVCAGLWTLDGQPHNS